MTLVVLLQFTQVYRRNQYDFLGRKESSLWGQSRAAGRSSSLPVSTGKTGSTSVQTVSVCDSVWVHEYQKLNTQFTGPCPSWLGICESGKSKCVNRNLLPLKNAVCMCVCVFTLTMVLSSGLRSLSLLLHFSPKDQNWVISLCHFVTLSISILVL